MKHLGAWLAWWLALFWLWLLLVGEWDRQQWVAAAGAATISATLAEFARVRTGFSARLPSRALADVPAVLSMVIVDFGIVAWALLISVVRRKIVRGELISRELESGTRAVRGTGHRAWTALAATFSPNAYVIDMDPETRVVLLHDLVPHSKSERPA